MKRKNHEQILKEEKVDLKREYERLYHLFYVEKYPDAQARYYFTLREFCAGNFMQIPFRGTCLSLDDFEESKKLYFERHPRKFNLNYLLLFCEYSYNLAWWLCPKTPSLNHIGVPSQEYVKQVLLVVEKIGYTKVNQGDIEIFVPKDPAAMAVSEIVEDDVSYRALEYNHYSLKGDIARKRDILRILADKLEPQRKQLKGINSKLEDDVFALLNNLNIRHNNCMEGDKNYKEIVAKMTQDELEGWYDETYQMCLLAFLELDNVERTKKVAELKASFGK